MNDYSYHTVSSIINAFLKKSVNFPFKFSFVDFDLGILGIVSKLSSLNVINITVIINS